jgi:tetratricopeptide (TPR) repeat protein
MPMDRFHGWQERSRQSKASLWLVMALVVGLLAGLATPAGAVTENRKKAEALFVQAVTAYKANDLKTAASTLEEAVKLEQHPTLLYNLAMIYDKLGDKENAVRVYKEYLKTIPPDDLLGRVRLKQLDPKAIDALDGEIAEAKAAAAAGIKPVIKPKAGGESTEPVAAPEVPSVKEPITPSTGGGGGLSKVRVLTWGLLGLGVVGLGVGGAFGVMANGSVDDFNSAKLRSEAEDAKDKAESQAMLSNIGFAVGGAAVVAGAVLLVLNLTSEDKAAPAASGSGGDLSWSVAPLLGPEGGGLSLGVSF